ncbi:MAG: hypothetical protein UT24_C0011G0036 [Candidatus Woesebacteria bacterium GW2011_GWB1_39_12]|uniref:Uncharacterized protein n=1 Tax=Candidatus Woesebacteria bacterium GW2011_GWB1_39_12 TaxID=1618574 RepID=A0A0G0MBM4_9BACT|nr:MAG: hypothetical protein UT24_C0011G0036 [Candidatus Woesebacteria bacterium GW2011_GWB1_39_12]
MNDILAKTFADRQTNYFEYFPESVDKKYVILNSLHLNNYKYVCLVNKLECQNVFYIRSKQDLLNFSVDYFLSDPNYLKHSSILTLPESKEVFSSEGLFFDILGQMAMLNKILSRVSVADKPEQWLRELHHIKSLLRVVRMNLQIWLVEYLKRSEFIQ